MSSSISKPVFIAALILFIVLGLLTIVFMPDGKPNQSTEPDTTSISGKVVKAKDEPIGEAKSKTEALEVKTFEKDIDYIVKFPDEVSEVPQVTEFFSYMCSHCFNFEPVLARWVQQKPDSVRFKKVPVSFGRTGHWGFAVKAYYIAEELNLVESFSRLLFRQIHIENNPPQRDSDLIPIFSSLGIDETTFNEAANSEKVASKVIEAEKLTKKYQVSGVPYFLINNKYESGPRSFESEKALFNLWNKLPGKDF